MAVGIATCRKICIIFFISSSLLQLSARETELPFINPYSGTQSVAIITKHHLKALNAKCNLSFLSVSYMPLAIRQ